MLGGLPFALLLAWYDHAFWLSLFALNPHASVPEWSEDRRAIYRHRLAIALKPLLASHFTLSRAVFFGTDIPLFGLRIFHKPRISYGRHRVKIAAIMVTVVLMAGYHAAHGGWAFGPRYLVLIMPLLLDSFFDGEIYECPIYGKAYGLASRSYSDSAGADIPVCSTRFCSASSRLFARYLTDEHWYTPNLANVFDVPSTIWPSCRYLRLLVLTLYLVLRNMRRPRRFFDRSGRRRCRIRNLFVISQPQPTTPKMFFAARPSPSDSICRTDASIS